MSKGFKSFLIVIVVLAVIFFLLPLIFIKPGDSCHAVDPAPGYKGPWNPCKIQSKTLYEYVSSKYF